MERKEMDNVIKQLKQFKTDAIYEKKKHYNAADRKRRSYKWVSITQIVLNAITSTALFAVVFGNNSKVAQIIALVITIVATILAGVQKISDFENQAQGNTKAADMYLRICKKINLTINLIKDGAVPNEEIVKKAEEICIEISQANEIGSQFSTSPKDYIKAKESIKNGEENYTDAEINLWE